MFPVMNGMPLSSLEPRVPRRITDQFFEEDTVSATSDIKNGVISFSAL